MSDEVIIPFPEATNRERTAQVANADDWVSPYTGTQALAIALFNNQVIDTLDGACRIAEAAVRSLKPMGFTVEFTGVQPVA